MEVHQLARMIESFIPGGIKYVELVMRAIHICPVNPSLWRLVQEIESSTGLLKPQDVIEVVEVLESLVYRGYIKIERCNGRPRLFALTEEGRKALSADLPGSSYLKLVERLDELVALEPFPPGWYASP